MAFGCQGRQDLREQPIVKSRIPVTALAFGGHVHDDFLKYLLEKHACNGHEPADACLRGYDVIVEDRDENYYFLVLPKDRNIKGGGMSYLVNAKSGEIVQRTIQK
jgi:hypothetical protein